MRQQQMLQMQQQQQQNLFAQQQLAPQPTGFGYASPVLSNLPAMVIKNLIDPTIHLRQLPLSAQLRLNLQSPKIHQHSILAEHTILILQQICLHFLVLNLPAVLSLTMEDLLNPSTSGRRRSWERMKHIWQTYLRIGMTVRIHLEILALCGMCFILRNIGEILMRIVSV